jgi:hypothetical protein
MIEESDVCVLFIHHSNDKLTIHNYNTFVEYNPHSTIIPLSFDKGLNNRVVIDSKYLEYWDTTWQWYSTDALIYGWFLSPDRIYKSRYLIAEYDMVCLEPIVNFYGSSLNYQFTCAHYQLPGADWYWYRHPSNQSIISYGDKVGGVSPQTGTVLSYDCLNSIVNLGSDNSLFYNVYCEMRLCTLAKLSGYYPIKIREDIDNYISYNARNPDGKGIWHKVSDSWLLDSRGIPYKV